MSPAKRPIRYVGGDQTLLDQIQLLWEGLNQIMCQRSTHFKEHFAAMTFARRKADLLEKAAVGLMHVDLAVDQTSGQNVGYLVSSLNRKKVGEIESIFVSEEYRGQGVGGHLMRNALKWMDQNGAVDKVVEATVGNESVLGFYARFGFLPRLLQLKQLKRQ